MHVSLPHFVFWRPVISLLSFASLAAAQEARQQQLAPLRLYVEQFPITNAPPHETIDPKAGQLLFFDRVKNQSPADDNLKAAIANSNTLLSGTVVRYTNVMGCWTYDWNITVLAQESSNVIVYRPGDASVFCDPQPPPPPPSDPKHPPAQDPNQNGDLYVVVPVKAIWVEITGFRGDLNDPARKAPGGLQSAPYCWDNVTTSPTSKNPNGIVPCDVKEKWLRRFFYNTGWLYNRLTVPGAWAGSFSIAPQVVQKVTQTLTEDIRFYGSSKAGPGWLGLNVGFEKSASVASNLDSLTGAITYDFHLWEKPWWGFAENKINQGVGVRPGELVLSTGQEYADTRTKGPNGLHYPKDLNVVEGIYYKQPVSVTAFSFPSFLTLFPVVGVEGGWHLIRRQPGESAQFFRKVAGIDASIRYPFHQAPNFTSTKGATIDYSFRERFLSGSELYTDTHPLDSMGNLLTVTPILSRQRRSYSRIALNWPLSNYVAINATVQRGSLPPDFPSIAWTLTLGLAFASTGTAEH